MSWAEDNGIDIYDGWDFTKPDSEIWVCRDGREILISQMTDQHLKNAIRCCASAKTTYLVEEAKRRGLEI